MAWFTLTSGTKSLCSWNTDTGAVQCLQDALTAQGLVVLDELERASFSIDPAESGYEHRLFIGDIPLPDLVPFPEYASGLVVGDKRHWVEHPYFESARGKTEIRLQSRTAGSSEEWTTRLRASVYVLPSKVTEVACRHMDNDLRQISRSLLLDLFGKSRRTYDLRLSRRPHGFTSRQEELSAIDRAVSRMERSLSEITHRPSSRIRVDRRSTKYWGTSRLSPLGLRHLARTGTSPNTTVRPLSVVELIRHESFDIPENRLILGFLMLLRSRASFCGQVARDHIRSIQHDRPFRDLVIGGGPSLFETEDLPRIRKLRSGVLHADELSQRIEGLASLPWLRGLNPGLEGVAESSFQRSPAYRQVIGDIRRYLFTFSAWQPGDTETMVSKLTSRLFEQWSFLRIVDAFRAAGVDFQDWEEALRDRFRSKFLFDFDRGLTFEGELTSKLRIRVRYEPWILPADAARKRGETLCRGGAHGVAWSPDILVECLRQGESGWKPVYVVVLDCKYSKHVRESHRGNVSKYLEIRDSENLRQVVKQIWLILPGGSDGILSEDPAVTFSQDGPTCSADEAVHFVLRTNPAESRPAAADLEEQRRESVFDRFASGTSRYFRREFG